MPCYDPRAVTRVAVRLPRLRSLDLRCCSAAEDLLEADDQLDLAAATALTELRLHVCSGTAARVRQLQMPPRLQVLPCHLLATVVPTWPCLHTCRPHCVLSAPGQSNDQSLLLTRRLYM